MNINEILNLIGVGMAAVLLVLNLVFKKTLIGSFFKSYYNLMVIATTSLVLSFVVEFPIIPLTSDISEFLHHTFFIVFAVLSAISASRLPKEAAKYLEKK